MSGKPLLSTRKPQKKWQAGAAIMGVAAVILIVVAVADDKPVAERTSSLWNMVNPSSPPPPSPPPPSPPPPSPPPSPPPPPPPTNVLDATNKTLSELVDNRVKELIYSSCSGDQLRLKDAKDPISAKEFGEKLGKNETGGGEYTEAVTLKAPCRAVYGCCERTFFFRPVSSDFQTYEQVFVGHYVKYVYALFDKYKPKFVLDAGAKAGFSTVLFKLLWPDATIVALETDPGNFAALKKNTEGLENVHVVNGMLWNKKTKIGKDGDKFKEVGDDNKEAVQAYTVKDLQDEFKLPAAFDFVKIDIEGAEGQVFAPDANYDWTKASKVVSLELHDKNAGQFGLEDVSSRVAAALKQLPFQLASGNEHLLFVSQDVVDSLRTM